MSQAPTVADTTPEADGGASNAQETGSGERCTTRFDLIRLQEECTAYRDALVWMSSASGCQFGATARSLLQKWAKPEGKS